MDIKNFRYAKSHNSDFYKVLQQRVRNYFKENNISQKANTEMVIKTIFMMLLYIVPYIFMVTMVSNTFVFILMWILMGFGMAGIGLSIMHDANHGSYTSNVKLNGLIERVMGMVGGSRINWRIQHNVLHHTYTNVDGIDEDIDAGIILRFSPHQERKGFHRFQHIYAWFLYGFLTILWCTSKDFKQAIRYHKMDLLSSQSITFTRHMTEIVISKVLYFAILIAIPIIFTPVSWYWTVIGFFIMQYIAGFLLSIIFQPAHVIPSSSYPKPLESGDIEADWAVNQLYNTCNFGVGSKWFTWYVGGLNMQVEHHLFPNICHVHYKEISKLVKQTAQEFNLPYHSKKTFLQALAYHGSMLRALGNGDKAQEFA